MKARIYEKGFRGVVLKGEVQNFSLGMEGWSLTLKGGRKECEEIFDEIKRVGQRGNIDILKEANMIKTIKSRMVLSDNDDTVWIGFNFDSGYRVQVYEESSERV